MLEHGDGGAIVNWSSIGGLNASPFTSVYSAAKAGVIALTKAAAIEYGAQGHPRQLRSAPASSTPRSWARRPEQIPGMLEKAALRTRRAARGGGRGRRVPRVGPGVVRQRRDHPRRRRLVREARVSGDRRRRRRRGPLRRARASTASRTPGCSPATAPSSTTSRCPGCCTRASCAARSPAPRSAASTRRPRSRCPGCARVFTAADLNPGVKEQWHTSIGPAEPGDAAPAARRRRGALRRRPGRAGRRREPLRRRGRRRAGRRRLRAAARVVDYTTAEDADALVHERHGSNVIGEIDGLPASALDDVFASAAHVVERDDLPAGVRAGADGGPRPRRRLRRARPASSRSTRRRSRRTRCGCSAPACSACPSTASAS